MTRQPTTPAPAKSPRHDPEWQEGYSGDPPLADRDDVHEQRETLAKLVGKVLAIEWLRCRLAAGRASPADDPGGGI
jgi:hypothetical protein